MFIGVVFIKKIVVIVIGALNMWISAIKDIKLSLSTCVQIVHRLCTCSSWVFNFLSDVVDNFEELLIVFNKLRDLFVSMNNRCMVSSPKCFSNLR